MKFTAVNKSLSYQSSNVLFLFFSFQNKFYEQVEGVAMKSLVSPIVAKLYMEHFDRKALWSASQP